MGRPVFQVINPGVFTTIQAGPRKGYFASGIPPSGAMDRFSLRMGNLLVKNSLEEAGLEVTGVGVKLKALSETVIAPSGADFGMRVDGRSFSPWRTILVKKNDVLEMGSPSPGWRAYLAVAGGFDVPEVLGSKSTYTLGGLGGFKGRALKKGDILEAGEPRDELRELKGRRVKEKFLPLERLAKELRVVLGPQDDHVKPESIETFLNTEYQVSIHSNRVGYRFQGAQLYFHQREQSKDAGSDPSNIVDDGNAIGAIQIPAGKEPICLGPDGVTMGGYVKIACLITADMDRMAQLRPRDRVSFRSVTIEEARNILLESIGWVREENVIQE
jgi:biotin-dependent carboxylase-like uncharacterized protein